LLIRISMRPAPVAVVIIGSVPQASSGHFMMDVCPARSQAQASRLTHLSQADRTSDGPYLREWTTADWPDAPH
jgi:hypothetical protein